MLIFPYLSHLSTVIRCNIAKSIIRDRWIFCPDWVDETAIGPCKKCYSRQDTLGGKWESYEAILVKVCSSGGRVAVLILMLILMLLSIWNIVALGDNMKLRSFTSVDEDHGWNIIFLEMCVLIRITSTQDLMFPMGFCSGMHWVLNFISLAGIFESETTPYLPLNSVADECT